MRSDAGLGHGVELRAIVVDVVGGLVAPGAGSARRLRAIVQRRAARSSPVAPGLQCASSLLLPDLRR
jgi:hypothetical protein